jgi:hypothetical protein
MTEEQKQVTNKKQSKILEQYAETKDPFVNALYKKLRNCQKKLTKIDEVEIKIKTKEIQATPDLLEKLQRKSSV